MGLVRRAVQQPREKMISMLLKAVEVGKDKSRMIWEGETSEFSVQVGVEVKRKGEGAQDYAQVLNLQNF